MKSYRPAYFLGEAFKGMWRNKRYTVATIFVLIGCLIIIGCSYIIYENVDYNMDKLGLVKEITIFLDRDVTPERALEIGEEIKLLDNVDKENVRFISKEDALKEESEKYSNYVDLYDVLEGDNPYRDSYIIPYISNEGYSTLIYHLNHIAGSSDTEVKEIAKINDRNDLANNFENLKNGILLVIIIFMAILLVVCIFVIVNTIGLAVMARAEEIVIMRYIGATGWFIAMPFVIEGIVIGLISSISAYFAQSLIYNYLVKTLSDFSIVDLCPFGEISSFIFVGFLVIGLLCGIIGSFMSMKKYIKA